MPELFERIKPVKEKEVAQPQTKVAERDPSANNTAPPSLSPNQSAGGVAAIPKEWHYAIQGNQMGPVSTPEMIELIRHRSLTREDIVWKQGMAQWMQAGYLPELVGAFAKPSARSQSASFGVGNNEPKNKTTAIVLALLLGSLGIHHFYLGNTLRGILMLVLLFAFVGVLVNPLIALIELILIASAKDEDFQAKWCNRGMNF